MFVEKFDSPFSGRKLSKMLHYGAMVIFTDSDKEVWNIHKVFSLWGRF